MNKKLTVLVLLPLAVLGAILPGQIIPRAHAAGQGLVCILEVTAPFCPLGTGPTFNGPLTTPNSLLRIPVWINNTDPFLGFDITVNSSDTSKLKPYGVDMIGSILPSGSITLVECVGGVLIAGSTCSPTDNPSTVHLAVVGPFGFLSTQGATGLLFTAIFSITGTTLPGGVKINYQDKCSNTSSGTFCVTITNGTTTPVTEATRGAGFDNSDTTTLPYATLSTSTINLGQSLVGAPTHALPIVTYTASSQNGFETSSFPQLTLATSFNGSGTRPTVSLNTTFLDLTGLLAHPFTQTGNLPTNVPVGVYIATVTATYQTSDLITFTPDSLSAAYSLPVNVTDYTVNPSPNPVTVQPASSQPVTVTIAPKASFNTLVKLGLTIPAATVSAGISASYSSSTISGGSGTSTLTVTTTASTPAGTYTMTVTSNSTLNGFTKTHSTTLTIKTGGFTVSASTPSAQVVGTSETSTITVTYLNSFTGTVALTNNTVTNLACTVISPTSVTANGTATVSCSSSLIGTYTLIILGASGPIFRLTTATFTFTAGFTMAASSPPITNVGAAATSTITVTYISGFTGTVTLTNNTIANLTCLVITPSSLTTTGTATVSCITTLAGTYSLTVTGTSGLSSVSTTATFTFSFLSHDVAISNTTTINPSSSTTAGTKVVFTVQVQNKGQVDERVIVTLLADNLTLQARNVALAADSNQDVIFIWDTTAYAAKTYALTASVQLAAGETNLESGNQVVSQSIGSYTLQPVAGSAFSFDTTTIALIAIIVIAVAALAGIIFSRRRRTVSTVSTTTYPGSQ